VPNPTVTASALEAFAGDTVGVSPSVNAATGATVWVGIGQIGAAMTVTSVTDSAGNTYTKKASGSGSGGPSLSIWVADNITGSASLVVTYHASTALAGMMEVVVMTGQASPSFDKASALVSGAVGGASVVVSPSVAPANGSDLLLGFFAVQATSATLATGYGVFLSGITATALDIGDAGEAGAVCLSLTVLTQAASGTGAQKINATVPATPSGLAVSYAAMSAGCLP
jgi:hypothetical protein